MADLSCGHTRHFRHNPPWQEREWVTTPEGRDQFLGTELDCKECVIKGYMSAALRQAQGDN